MPDIIGAKRNLDRGMQEIKDLPLAANTAEVYQLIGSLEFLMRDALRLLNDQRTRIETVEKDRSQRFRTKRLVVDNMIPGYVDFGDVCPVCDTVFFTTDASDHSYCSQECMDEIGQGENDEDTDR